MKFLVFRKKKINRYKLIQYITRLDTKFICENRKKIVFVCVEREYPIRSAQAFVLECDQREAALPAARLVVAASGQPSTKPPHRPPPLTRRRWVGPSRRAGDRAGPSNLGPSVARGGRWRKEEESAFERKRKYAHEGRCGSANRGWSIRNALPCRGAGSRAVERSAGGSALVNDPN